MTDYGNGWSALGAALTNGMGAWQEQSRYQMQLKRQKEQDERERQQFALQKQLLADQVNELPQKHAESDLDRFLKVQGDAAWNNPAFAGLAERARMPLNIQAPAIKTQLGQVEKGNGGKVESRSDIADRLGIAPDTGIVLPPEVKARESARAKDAALDDLKVTLLKNEGTGSGNHWDFLPDGKTKADTPHNREVGARYAKAGLDNPITAMWGNPIPASGTPDAITAAAAARAEATAQSAIGEKAKSALQTMASVQSLMNEVKPLLKAKNPTDPTGEHASYWHLFKEKGEAVANKWWYDAGLPQAPADGRIIQLAGLIRVLGTAPFMAGSRNFALIQAVWEHLTNPTATPEATLQKINELEIAYPEIEKELRTAALPPPRKDKPPQELAPPTPEPVDQSSKLLSGGETTPVRTPTITGMSAVGGSTLAADNPPVPTAVVAALTGNTPGNTPAPAPVKATETGGRAGGPGAPPANAKTIQFIRTAVQRLHANGYKAATEKALMADYATKGIPVIDETGKIINGLN